MKDKNLFKKWWFWVVIVVALGALGSLSKADGDTKTNDDTKVSQATSEAVESKATLPVLNVDDYKGEEGLLAYKDLQSKGYTVSANFEKEALTDINGKASDLFESLNPNKPDDKESVDAFIVGSLAQDGDSATLTIVLRSS